MIRMKFRNYPKPFPVFLITCERWRSDKSQTNKVRVHKIKVFQEALIVNES